MSQKKLQSVNVYDIKNSSQSDTLLADAYGVSRKTIYNIKNGLRYKNVGPKTLRAYPGVKVFNDGWVLNKKNDAIATSLSDTVKLSQRNGKKVSVQVSTLVSKAFG
jgi:DNA-binding XRE family transcriptional regulator